MKKLFIALVVCITVIAIAVSVTVPIVIHKRGDISAYPVSENLITALGRSAAAFPKANPTEARIMTLNLLAHYEDFGGTDARPRAALFFELLNAYQPDVIGVQEMCDQWYCCLTANKNNYRLIRPLTTGAFVRMTAILYNTDTLTLLESGEQVFTEKDDGRMRRVVWGLFEVNTTGKQFLVTNTHFNLLRFGLENEDLKTMLSQAEEQVALTKELSETYACPVFTVGDFNAKERANDTNDSSPVYQKLTAALRDTKDFAQMRTFGSEKNPQNTSNDHILLLGNARITQYSILSQNSLSVMSDHYPLFVDAQL